MTTYSVYGEGTSGQRLAVKAGTYELRIHSVTFLSSYAYPRFCYMYRHAGPTFSGGSAVSAVSLRGGAPAASATARVGSLTLGTSSQVDVQVAPAGITRTYNMDLMYYQVTYHYTDQAYQPSLPITIPPGDVFSVTGLVNDSELGGIGIVILFEELRLSWTL